MTDDAETKFIDEMSDLAIKAIRNSDPTTSGLLQQINTLKQHRAALREKALTMAINSGANANEQLRTAQLYYDYLRG